METCGRAGIMGLWSLATHPRNLLSLIFRLLPKLLRQSTGLLKKFLEDGHVHSPWLGTSLGTMPDLPQDILMDIFATLEIPDLVRVGSVCSSWRSAYTKLRDLGQYKASQTPCLLYTSESAGENVACLYSLAEKRTYKLTLPEPPIRSRYLIGSSHGWLVTVDERSEMHLVNPITGEQIALPSVVTIEHVKPIFDEPGVVGKYELSYYTARQMHYKLSDPEHVKLHVKHTFDKFEVVGKYEPTERKVYRGPSVYAIAELREHFQYKAFVFPDPETSKGSYIVALIHDPQKHLSFARVGDDKWIWLPPYTDYEDCSYKNGLLYAITIVGEIHVFDLNGPVITRKIIMGVTKNVLYESDNTYIVHAPWGDLLNVWRTLYEDEGVDPIAWDTAEVEINKVDTAAKKLEEFKCLHDHVLFLGHNQSLCLDAKDHPHLKANHVYFTDNYLWFMAYKNSRRDIGVFNLESNSPEALVSPQLWSNWPSPMWITPSLAKMNVK